jgi:hypothetical protein
MAKTSPKQIVLAVFSFLAIAGAAAAIYMQTRPPGINAPLHRAIGEVLAEQAAALTNRGKIVVITIDGQKYPELKAQMEGFENALARFPKLELYRTEEVDTEGKSKYGPGRGLSESRFLRNVKKYSGRAAVVISFIGSPELNEDQLKELPKPMPLFIAETRARDEVVAMFGAGAIHAAVVPRFIFPAPVEKPGTAREWFDMYFQVINPSSLDADDHEDSTKPAKQRVKDAAEPKTTNAAPSK